MDRSPACTARPDACGTKKEKKYSLETALCFPLRPLNRIEVCCVLFVHAACFFVSTEQGKRVPWTNNAVLIQKRVDAIEIQKEIENRFLQTWTTNKEATPTQRKARTIFRGLMKDLDSITSFLSQRILMACHLTLNPSRIKPKLNSSKPFLRTQFINVAGVIDYGFNMKLEDKGINSPSIQQIHPLSKS
ncbi:hypothetical protein CDAR_595381 [Caerostris darwini]|uniref:Uncharacterized protein n=1 Tax=Caerostris darwini TaxID=1538125 RepID=A0AAV4SL62_9ARAC|nr:hypothetical protein CDAR_595381 [Caerostris darwini]